MFQLIVAHASLPALLWLIGHLNYSRVERCRVLLTLDFFSCVSCVHVAHVQVDCELAVTLVDYICVYIDVLCV